MYVEGLRKSSPRGFGKTSLTSTVSLETLVQNCRDGSIAGRGERHEEAGRSKRGLDKFKDTAQICKAGRQGHFKEFRFILMTVGKQQRIKIEEK